MGNKNSHIDNSFIYRKRTLEKVSKYIIDSGINEICMVIHVKSKDHENALDLCDYMKEHGYHAEYTWSWSHDTGYCGRLDISVRYSDKIQRSSFDKDHECSCCFAETMGKDIQKYKCGHKVHKQCKKSHKKCPICEFETLKRKSIQLDDNT